MALRLTREVSETPNISNRDDACMARYAYGGYDGIIQHIGEECMLTLQSSKMHVGSGRLVIQGWEVDVEPEDFDLSWVADPKQYTYLCVKIDLLLEAASWVLVSTSDNILAPYGDDLTQNSAGARVTPVYRWNSLNGSDPVVVLSHIEYDSEFAKNIHDKITEIEDIIQNHQKQLGDHVIDFSSEGVLKIDGEQISYKKLLWEGSIKLPSSAIDPATNQRQKITVPITREHGKFYELWFTADVSGYGIATAYPTGEDNVFNVGVIDVNFPYTINRSFDVIQFRHLQVIWRNGEMEVSQDDLFVVTDEATATVTKQAFTSRLVKIYEYKEESPNNGV